jgi:hypothetical protein
VFSATLKGKALFGPRDCSDRPLLGRASPL